MYYYFFLIIETSIYAVLSAITIDAINHVSTVIILSCKSIYHILLLQKGGVDDAEVWSIRRGGLLLNPKLYKVIIGFKPPPPFYVWVLSLEKVYLSGNRQGKIFREVALF